MPTRKSIESLSKRIGFAASKLGVRGDEIQDVTQEILTRMLEGRHQHSTIDQAVIDYLRREYGDKRLLSHDQRKMLGPRFTEELKETFGSDRGLFDSNKFGDLANGESLRDALRLVTGRHDKAVFNLTHKWGFNEAEIADIFGVSPSRVCQWNERILKRVQQKIAAQEPSQRAREMEKVLCQKAEGVGWRVEQISFERMEIGESWSMASYNEKSF